MYWQRKLERSGDPMTLNNTYKLLLPYQGLLGSMYLRISGDEITALGSNGGSWRILDYISSVQIVVNGSVVIKSLTGYELQACAFYDQGVVPPSKWRNYASNTQFESFLLNFGRWLKDSNCGLDLSKYSSVELWITNTATGSQFTSLAVTVEDLYLMDAPSAQFPYYMNTQEWAVWTTVQDEWKYWNLPTEYPIRRILLNAIHAVDANNIATGAMADLMDEIKFLLDTGNTTVIDASLEYVMHENFLEQGKMPITGGWPYINNGKGIRLDVGETLFAAGIMGTQAGTIATVDPTIDSARSDFTQVGYSYLADHPMGLVTFGLAPFETAVITTNQDEDVSSFLDPNARKTVQLNIHTRNSSSAASGRNAIVLDRLYPAGK